MKRLYLIALFALVCGGASAQENGNRDAQNRIVRGPYETNRFFDNVFVGVAGGVNLYFGENDSEGKFGKRLAPAMDIHVGKWFTPAVCSMHYKVVLDWYYCFLHFTQIDSSPIDIFISDTVEVAEMMV